MDPGADRALAQVEPSPTAASVFKTLAGAVAGQALGAGILLAMAYIVLGVPLRRLASPFLLLSACGAVFGSLTLWARRAPRHSKRFAIRWSIAMSAYFAILATVAIGSAISLGVFTADEAFGTAGVPALLMIGFVGISGYRRIRASSPGEAPVEAASRRESTTVLKILAYAVFGHALAAGVIVAAIHFWLNVPTARLGTPFVLLTSCGMVLGGQLIGMRHPWMRQRSFAVRISVVTFVYLEILTLAVIASELSLGYASRERLFFGQVVPVTNLLALVTIAIFFAARRWGDRDGQR